MRSIIILVGGFGSRLQSVSNGIPKALMPIGDSVYLDLLLDNDDTGKSLYERISIISITLFKKYYKITSKFPDAEK